MVALHQLLSWTLTSFVLPIIVGVHAVMTLVRVGLSDYWVFHPWTWGLTASNGGLEENRAFAMVLGPVFTALVVIGAWFWAERLRRDG